MIAPTPDCALRALPRRRFQLGRAAPGYLEDGYGDVPEIHQNARRQLLDEAEQMKGTTQPRQSPRLVSHRQWRDG